jgi:hypothetical protein
LITVYGNDGSRLPVAYNGYSLNVMSGVEDRPAGTRLIAAAHANAIDYISENREWTNGMEVYGITRTSRVIQLAGYIHGVSKGDLKDREEVLCNAFDPGAIAWENDDPFLLPLTFSVPTADTATFPTGYIPSKYLAVPIRMPEPIDADASGLSARFAIPMLLRDPRRYHATVLSRAGDGTLANTLADYRSYATITFTMSAAGHASFTAANTATRQGALSLVLDLSGRSAAQAITVDFDRRRVLVNGTVTQAIFKSGDWWEVEPGTNTLAFTNTTGVGTITTSTYPAFSY